MYIFVCILLGLIGQSTQSAHIEATESQIQTAIESIQDESLWAEKEPELPFTKRYKNNYFYHPPSPGNLRAATAECLQAGGKLYANSPLINPREIFALYRVCKTLHT